MPQQLQTRIIIGLVPMRAGEAEFGMRAGDLGIRVPVPIIFIATGKSSCVGSNIQGTAQRVLLVIVLRGRRCKADAGEMEGFRCAGGL